MNGHYVTNLRLFRFLKQISLLVFAFSLPNKFAGSCLSGLGIVMKKPFSAYGFSEGISLKQLSLSKDKDGFFIMSPYP
jgi:hypothetical protein